MATGHIEDRAGGPGVAGSRITVNDIFQYLLDPTMTEDGIARLFSLTLEDVAAARSYVLTHPETVLARHLQLEERSRANVNPPEVVEKMDEIRETFARFQAWAAIQKAEQARQAAEDAGDPGRLPTFREWLAEQESTGPRRS